MFNIHNHIIGIAYHAIPHLL